MIKHIEGIGSGLVLTDPPLPARLHENNYQKEMNIIDENNVPLTSVVFAVKRECLLLAIAIKQRSIIAHYGQETRKVMRL
jgi:hypothetical protein